MKSGHLLFYFSTDMKVIDDSYIGNPITSIVYVSLFFVVDVMSRHKARAVHVFEFDWLEHFG